MATIHRELKANEHIKRLCSPSPTPGYLGIYSGWLDRFDDTVYSEPACSWHEAVADYQSIVGSEISSSVFSDDPVSISITLNGVDTAGLYPGLVGYFESTFSERYSCVLDYVDGNTIVIKLLDYDSSWTNGALTVTGIYLGGLCYLKLMMDEFSDKFHNAAVYGVDSRMTVYIAAGSYAYFGNLNVSQGGISLLGLNEAGDRARVYPLEKRCDGPDIYLGDPDDIETVAYGYYFAGGDYTVVDGINLYSNVPGSASNNNNYIVWPGPVVGSKISFRLAFYGVENLLYGVSVSGVDVGDMIIEPSLNNSAVASWSNFANSLYFSGILCGRGNGTAAGMFTSITDPPHAMSDIVVIGGSYGLLIVNAGSLASGGIQYGNIIIDNYDNTAVSAFRIAASPSTHFAKTAVITGYSNSTMFSGPAGTEDLVGMLHIERLAVQGVTEIPQQISYDELIILDDDERVYRDRENFDFTIVHPLLIEKRIGVYDNEIVLTRKNLRERL